MDLANQELAKYQADQSSNANLKTPTNTTLLLTGQILLCCLLAYWILNLIRPTDPTPPWIFLDFLNLLVHEAGHWLFWPLGSVMHVLGGSLNQVLLPAVFTGYFIYRRDWTGTAFGIFWVGDNLVNVSYYIGDARAIALPLLGGDPSGHDWHWLLDHFNLLNYDQSIAHTIYGLGAIALILSITLIVLIASQQAIQIFQAKETNRSSADLSTET